MLSPYRFMEELNSQLDSFGQLETVVVGSGSSFYIVPQKLEIKEGQRMIVNEAQGDMGACLPMCIGVAIAGGKTIGIDGDGSFMFNIQELETIKYHNLPIKFFIWNNNGYGCIRNTQDEYFGRRIGTDASNGISFPDFKKVIKAFGLKYVKIDEENLESGITETLKGDQPVIAEVMLEESYTWK